MPTQWQSVYNDVCNVLLEPNGLTLGLITDAQFLQFASEVLPDFLVKSGISKNLFCIPLDFQQTTYPLPDGLSESLSAMVDQRHIWRSAGQPLDTFDPAWRSRVGNPEAWREDDLPAKTIEISPAPDWYGMQVDVFPAGVASVPSATSNANDFDIVPVNSGYGTISAVDGNPFTAVNNPGYGVVSRMVPSADNLEIMGLNGPSAANVWSLAQYIEQVPDPAVPYLKYGILSKIFASDSEHKDTQKAAYCAARYQEGVSALSSALLDMGG